MKLTAKRHAWLQCLAIGPAERSKTNVGYYCMQAGWTEWNYVDNGEQTNASEARARYGDQWWDHVDVQGERLTEAGRKLVGG